MKNAFERLSHNGWTASKFSEVMRQRYQDPIASFEIVIESEEQHEYKLYILKRNLLIVSTCILLSNEHELKTTIKYFPISDIHQVVEEIVIPNWHPATTINWDTISPNVSVLSSSGEIVSIDLNQITHPDQNQDLKKFVLELQNLL